MAEMILKGESKLFYYTGGVQSIVLSPGKYKLEVWGAQGGTMTGSWTGVGGLGGYACGEIELKQETTFYIYCGGQGVGYNGSSYHAGGWNGGGSCQGGASGGGGATDISLKNAAWNSNDHLKSRIIVAGGGGGSNDHVNGGAGGGTIGNNGTIGNASIIGNGGTQTSGGAGWINGSFGIGGGSSNSHGDGGAGGGGWYGGGKANGNNAAGGGGSGYVYTQDTEVNYPEGCLLNSDYFLTNTSMQTGVTYGNGYARITCIDGSQLTSGMSKQFNYTGYAQGITLLPGEYLFECYGASGGGASGATIHTIGSSGGLGGYTKAIMHIIEEITVYCYVGSAGFYGSGGSAYGGPTGGWNGGGNGGNNGSGSGGGATDFRISGGNWNDINSLKSRFIVAGGGGGADNGGDVPGGGDDGSGGSGGGLSAQGAWINGGYNAGYAGTQNSGNALGIGANVSTNTDTGGAGGGWYGGYVSNHNNGGGGGGSSYIKGYPGCNTSYHGNQANVEYMRDGVLDIGKQNGNGYARITCISNGRKITAIKNQGISEIINHANNGYFYAQPGTIPELSALISPGYDFKDWTGDFHGNDKVLHFVMPDKNVTVIANATPRNDTKYKVNHYLADNTNNVYSLEDSFEYQGITDTLVTPPTIEYAGFKTPEEQTVSIDGSGNLVVDYYYLRNSFILTVINGTSDKMEYLYGEVGNLEYTKMENVTDTFKHWYSELLVNIHDATKKNTTFEMPPYDITIFVISQPNRLNTNIYKNIFPEDVFNLEKIEKLRETTPTTLYDITQEKHGFIVGNVLCCIDGRYQKALACNGPENIPVGIVTSVANENVFTLMSTGIYDWKQYNYEDTTILYLSDVFPGMLVHYDQIKSRIFVPVAVYVGNGQILMNIQDITIGAPMASYEKYSQNFDTYEQHELDEVIQHAISGVMLNEG